MAALHLFLWPPAHEPCGFKRRPTNSFRARRRRRGIDPDALADELVRTKLEAVANGDLDAALAGLAELRASLPDIDGVALAREARRDLEQRDA